MIHFLRRLLFHIYVYFIQRQAPISVREAPRFIWKYAWFFFWHRFFWASGRGLLSWFTQVRPLLGEELSEEAHRHYDRFNELAARDFRALSFQNKVIHPTRYKLAPDTAKELCLFYMCIAEVAPWQYGVEARHVAKLRMRNYFLLSLLGFIVLCNVYVAGSALFAWTGYMLFNALLLTGAGWYADSALHLIAREGERIRAEEKQKHLD
jgi:hypothetical protein